MRLRSSIKFFLAVCCVLLCGCARHRETVLLKTWIHDINEQAGIHEYGSEVPYYLNVTADDPLFADVQAAVEWKILDPSYPFDPDAVLTKEWAAFTLMRLAGSELESDFQVKDGNTSMFPKEVAQAVSSGLMKTDARGLFRPKEVMDRQEAYALLSDTVSYVNHRSFADADSQMLENTDTVTKEAGLLEPDPADGSVKFDENMDIHKGDIIHWQDMYGREHYSAVSENSEGKPVLRDAQVDDIYSSVDISGESDIDFSRAGIWIQGEPVQESGMHTGDSPYLHQAAAVTKTFSLNGFTVKLICNGTSLSAEASKKTSYGGEFFSAVRLNGMHASYSLQTDRKNISYAYFKVSFHTIEEMGLRCGSYRKLFGDFSKIDPKDFPGSLQNLFQTKHENVEAVLPLCTMQMPVPGNPLLQITVSLDLYVYASGKAEIVLTQNNEAGFEIRDGKVRMIRKFDKDRKAQISASAACTAGIHTGMALANMKIMDIGITAGAQANAQAMIHMYDKDGKRSAVNTDVPADLAEEMASDSEDVKVCTNLSGSWLLDLVLNSPSTMAAKLGLSRTVHVLNAQNAPLFGQSLQHFENGIAVARCTRTDRILKIEDEPVPEEDVIAVNTYSLILNVYEKDRIELTRLPEGVDRSQVIFTSEDPDIADVNPDGEVTGLQTGSTRILIRTADGKHTAHCSVLVSEP